MCDDRILRFFVKSLATMAMINCAVVSMTQATAAEDFDRSAYSEAIEAEKWDEAWELIKDADGTTDTQIFGERGMLLGSGFLSTGIHRCEAVLQFELAIEHGALWVRGMLNSLYAGDWMSFASIEGSRTALEYLS
ncbi:MAG: hypothetical protein GY798_29665, partial [Hyphomicrobiales bacterium]|nr:hypothetical protein [Hyphomicrobiales bacterium]